MTRASEPTVTRRPSGRTSSARNPPSSLSCTSAVTVNRPALRLEPSKISTSTGPTNEYPSILACSRAASDNSRESASMKLANRVTSAGERVTANEFGAMRPRTPTRRWRSISRVNRRPISTGCRLLRNGFANVPSTRRSRRSSNCWSPMVPERLPAPRLQLGSGRRLTCSPIPKGRSQPNLGRNPSDYCCPVTRASGGIGRRAGFRFLCPKGCAGSSPASPTTRRLQDRRSAGRAPAPPHEEDQDGEDEHPGHAHAPPTLPLARCGLLSRDQFLLGHQEARQ